MDKKERIVFVLGAGFSALAKLPIQDRILQEMIQKPASSSTALLGKTLILQRNSKMCIQLIF